MLINTQMVLVNVCMYGYVNSLGHLISANAKHVCMYKNINLGLDCGHVTHQNYKKCVLLSGLKLFDDFEPCNFIF